MTVEALSPIAVDVHYRQAIQPKHEEGSFVGNDTDNHDFIFAARGKRTITVAIDNAPNAELTWSLYGMHEADGDVGDVGTFEVDVTNALAATTKVAVTNTAAFPFYLLRCVYAVAPVGGGTVSVYVDLAGN